MTTFTGAIPTIAAGDNATVATNLAVYRDALKALSEAWTDYTPTWTGSVSNPTIGNGTLTGKYLRDTKFCAFRIVMAGGSTTTVGSGTYSFALPAAVHGTGEQVVSADFYDGANHYAASGLIGAGASVLNVFSTKGGASGSQVALGSTSFSAGSSALIVAQGVIELA